MTSDDAFMALAGVRYCLGRHTYAPSICCGWLKARWPEFKDSDRSQILREIKTHISDEEARETEREAVFTIDVYTWRAFVTWAAQTASHSRQGEKP